MIFPKASILCLGMLIRVCQEMKEMRFLVSLYIYKQKQNSEIEILDLWLRKNSPEGGT